DREVLTHAGRVSADAAKEHAGAEYRRWQTAQAALPQPVDVAFAEVIAQTKAIESRRPRRSKA
ncbi:MAG: hypothetical protein RIT28_55, partial [Pseudomonadota bacterium]